MKNIAAAHPDWKTITAQVVEKADNSFWAEHSINFVVTGYANGNPMVQIVVHF